MTPFGIPWTTWEPIYRSILADFGFDRSADEAARDRLVGLLDGTGLRPSELPDCHGQTVAVAGAADCLHEDIELAASADRVIAASIASEVLLDAGIGIDLHVTDLDKDHAIVTQLHRRSVPIVTHAHGDNISSLEKIVPGLDASTIFPTTQAEPGDHIFNPGGFTDGDRAAFLADALGATALTFPGWDITDTSVSALKRHKLAWAERLLYWLEQRRGDTFPLLDGRREELSLPGPISDQ